MPAKIYTDKDADLKHLKGKTLRRPRLRLPRPRPRAQPQGQRLQGHHRPLPRQQIHARSPSQRALKSSTPPRPSRSADVIFVAIPDTKQAGASTRRTSRPNLATGKTLLFQPRLRHPFQDHRPAQGRQRHPGRAQRPGPHRPPPVHRRQRRSRADRHLPGPGQASPRKSRSPGPKASAAPAPASSRPASRKKPRPTSSASKPSCAAAPAR